MVSKLLILLSVLFPPFASADPADDERITQEYRDAILGNARFTLIPGLAGERRSRLAIDAVEEILASGHKLDLPSIIPDFAWPTLNPKERSRWFRLGGIKSETTLMEKLEGSAPDPGLLYELLQLEPKLKTLSARVLIARLSIALPKQTATFRSLKARTFEPPSVTEVRSLFFDLPDIAHFQGGAWSGKPRLFLFCRHNRNYACLLAMKDKDDRAVRTGATLWTQAGLGLSGYGKPFNERLGNTPSGVQLINGVMPTADQTYSYGKFRRMLLEFPPASSGEVEMKYLLPPATYSSTWWKEAQIARDMGRGELRIHGTGQHNDQPDVLYYPFIATIGCVTQKEMKYGNTDYIDQRLLLDQLMRAQGLDPKYANEPAIRALLYVIDIDDKKTPVTAADLARYEIK